MSRFVLTAQLQLQAPTNTRQVLGQIRNQLSGRPIEVPVEVRGAAQAQRAVRDVTQEVQRATGAADALGRSFGLAIKRFAAFTVASRAVSLFTNSLANAVDEAIDFQREVVKIAQVTGTTVKQLDSLEKTITNLSTGLGVVSRDLLAVTRILSQAGVRGAELEVALSSLAKSTLAPTFGDITQTAEGAIAVIRQFKQGVGALEGQLGSINAVAGQFAVEADDLIGAVRRFGGVFKSAGGNLEELLALFTSVRQTTRESAESISTGLRTIFTRVQRPETIQYLRELGVELTNAEGRFIGPFKAAQALGKAFAELPAGDTKFISIAEELGGFRQIGKVIPLLQQYEVANRALAVAQEGQNSLTSDSAKAQQALAVQITKVKEEFLALVRGIAKSTSFQVFTRTALSLASAFIKIADTVKPLIPLLGAVAAFKFAQGFGSFLGGAGAAIRGLQTRNQGGPIRKFASGGIVPGVGNGDTVPAMLTPGEFVIRKSSVNKLGVDTLAAMNDNKFASGGVVNVKDPKKYGALVLDQKSGGDIASSPVSLTGTANKKLNQLLANERISTVPSTKELAEYTDSLSKKEQIERGIISRSASKLQINPRSKFKPSDSLLSSYKKDKGSRRKKGQELDYKIKGPFSVFGIGSPGSVQGELQKEFAKGASKALDAGAQAIFDSNLAESLSIGPLKFQDQKNFKVRDVLDGAQSTIEGYLLESVIGAAGDLKTGPDTTGGGIRPDFDFPNITKESKKKLVKLFDPNDDLSFLKRGDAKRTRDTAVHGDGRLVNKIAKDLKRSDFTITKANKGGGIGGSTDTVPALLTPGEFVINKKAAANIGASNLNAMNKSGVAKFAKGGAVGGIQKFKGGGGVADGEGFGGVASFGLAISAATAAVQTFGDSSEDASRGQFLIAKAGERLVTAVTTVGAAILLLGASGDKSAKALGKLGKSIDKYRKKRAKERAKKKDEKGRDKETLALADKQSELNVQKATGQVSTDKLLSKAADADNTARKATKVRKREQGVFERAKESGRPKMVVDKKEEAYIAALEKERKAKKRAKKANEDLTREIEDNKAATNRMNDEIKDLTRSEKTNSKVKDQSNKKTKKSTSDLKKFTKAVEGAGRAAKKSGGGGGGFKKLGKGIGKFAGIATVAVTAFNAIGTAITGLIADLAQRAKEEAIKSGNAGTASKEAGIQAQAEGFGEQFTFSGIMGNIGNVFEELGLKEGGGFAEDGERRQKNIERAEAEAAASAASTKTTAGLSTLENQKKSGKIDFAGISTGIGKELSVAVSEAQDLTGPERTTALAGLEGQAFDVIDKFADAGASIDQLNQSAKAMSGTHGAGKERLLAYIKSIEAARNAQELLIKANFDNLKVSSAFRVAANAVEGFTAGLQTGSNTVAIAMAELETAQNTIGADATGAIDKIEAALLDSASGASPALIEAIKSQGAVARGTNQFNQGIGGTLKDLNLKGNEADKKIIQDALVATIPKDVDEATTDKITTAIAAQVSQIDTSKAIDFKALSEGIFSKTKILSDGFSEAGKIQAAHNGKMIGLYQEREKVEATAAASLNTAIDTQIEAGKAFAEFGGDRLTTQQQTQARIAQFNNVGGLGGLGANLRTGSAEDIRRASTSISGTFNAQQQAGLGAFAGVEGVQNDQRPEAQRANAALITFTKQRIALLKEEITIVQAKNREEKSSLEKLISGDVQGFIKGQAAAGAGAALRSGSSGLASLFSGSALGAGFKSLEGQGLSDKENKRAADLTLSGLGITGGGAAGVLSGTTPEQEAVKAEGRELARVLGDVAGQGAQFDVSEIAINKATIVASEVKFKEELEKTSRRNQGFAKGGTVYANNGMFVPRGTDTVPAMLTPGEFVVNRSAVRQGNNLQVLRAMNSGSGASGPGRMSGGGSVQYYQDGGIVDSINNMFSQALPSLNNVFSDFASTVDRLVNTKFDVKLDTTNVNVNFTNASFLQSMKDDIREGLLEEVRKEIGRTKPNSAGDFKTGNTVLGT